MLVVDDFFSAANNVISQYSLNVEFVLDGAGTPTHVSAPIEHDEQVRL